MKRPALISGFTAKLRDDKGLETIVYAVLLAAALAIFLASGGASCGGSRGGKEAETETAASCPSERELEARLEAILSKIGGAGEVRVMITYETGAELVTAEDSSRTASEGGSSESTKPALVSNGGAQSPVVLRENMPRIRGAIVVAEGARDVSVLIKLQNAAVTVLGTEPSRVSVFPMDK
ncbi:MAG: hypothetical protein J5586_06355 [Clostridia bacterium]|nr:hypothetical protein [Clostridia bacterium]